MVQGALTLPGKDQNQDVCDPWKATHRLWDVKRCQNAPATLLQKLRASIPAMVSAWKTRRASDEMVYGGGMGAGIYPKWGLLMY